jgi:hypothetical protein
MEHRQIELLHSNYRRGNPHSIPNIFLIESRVSLSDDWHRIIGRTARGMESQMGCGFNVLAYLHIIPREVAQEFTNMIVLDDDDIGLLIPSMINFLELYFREHLYLDRYYWDWSENCSNPELSIHNFFDKLMNDMRREYDLQREILGQELYFYTIFKLLFDTETGLGHSVILRFDALKNEFDVIDPQKERITPIEGYKHYLNSPLADMYSGASMIIHNPSENEIEHSSRGSTRRGSTRRNSTRRNNYNRRTRNNRGNTRRSIITQRGGGIIDSDFSHLNKKELSKLKESSEKENKFFNNKFFKKFKRKHNK